MMRIFLLFIILSSTLISQNTHLVYFNEVRPDDNSTDDAQFIEIVGPAGTDLTGFIIIHYNGSDSGDGGLWSHTIGSFTIPNDCGTGIGFYVVGDVGVTNADETSPADLQNGPDGLVLYDTDGTTILDAIAWEGEGDMTTDDPGTVSTAVSTTSNNYLHITVDDDASDNSLNAPLNVVGDNGTGWSIATATPGAINIGQICSNIALPVELSSFTATSTNIGIILNWITQSEIENLGFIIERKTFGTDWQEIASYKNDETLMGQGTVSFPTNYEYIDGSVQKGNTYEYRLADVDYNGVVTYHATREFFVENNPLPSITDNFTVMAYPNPFNPSTTIRYSIPPGETMQATTVIAKIYDISGKLIATLVDKEQTAGWYDIQWNGTNQNGKEVPGGFYLSRINVGSEVRTNKLILLK
jgi:hypothetical protein